MVNAYQRAVDMLNGHLKNKIVQRNDGDYGEFINRMINGTLELTEYENDEVTKINTYLFEGLKSLTSVSFPACTSIGDKAFYNCTSLTDVSFPACTNIGNYAFYGCKSLTSLYFTGSSVPSIASNSFDRISSTATFYVTPSMIDAFKSTSYWSAFASRIVAYEGE